MSRSEPQRTPLAARHDAAGARMVDFHGWLMPIQYEGIVPEHLHTRAAVGVFDVSHMGRFVFRGEAAAADLDCAVSCNVAGMSVGRCRYGLLLNEQGGIEDDLLVYRVAEHEYWLVVNASRIDHDAALIRERISSDTSFKNISASTAMLAIQGPKSKAAIAAHVDAGLDALRYYRCARGAAFGEDALVSRTGYTGELGYEIIFDAAAAERVWDAVLALPDAKPIGLGARDTLRLEAGMPLYGQDLTPDRTPVEAGLMAAVALDKEFVGRDAVAARAEAGASERLVGFALDGRRAARAHDAILLGDARVGEVSSGSFAPSLGHAIGMGYVAAHAAEAGTELTTDVRGKFIPARVVERPFYKDGTATTH